MRHLDIYNGLNRYEYIYLMNSLEPVSVPVSVPDLGKYYAITVRRTTKPAATGRRQDYLNHLEELSISKKFNLSEFKFETTGGLHMHGVIKFNPVRYSADMSPCYSVVSKNPLKYLRTRGWHTYVCPIHNMAGWQDYIQKEERTFTKLF